MKPSEFADLFRACREGREWAIANCATMDDVWANARPEWLVWIATRLGVLDDRTLRLFAVWSARQVQHLMTDQRSVAALDVAERHANGQATDEELRVARDAAQDAVGCGAWCAAWVTSQSPGFIGLSVAWITSVAGQAMWLRANAKPDWERARKMGGAR